MMAATVLLGTFNALEFFVFTLAYVQYNLIAVVYGEFLELQGLVFGLTCTANCVHSSQIQKTSP